MIQLPEPETSPLLSTLASDNFDLRHGFFNRHGGVSSGCFASLNVGFGSSDEMSNVSQNRRLCERALGAQENSLHTAYQIHSSNVVVIDKAFANTPPQQAQADALVTAQPGLMLGVLAADCMPYLFADPVAKIIAAAHAGWRGALAGILENTIAQMTELGASTENIHVCLGPCLRQNQFEVGLDLVTQFTEKYPDSEHFFIPGQSSEKRQFDLAGFGHRRLQACGIQFIDDLQQCTLANPSRYFSYRYSRQSNAPDFGRNLSAIMMASS